MPENMPNNASRTNMGGLYWARAEIAYKKFVQDMRAGNALHSFFIRTSKIGLKLAVL